MPPDALGTRQRALTSSLALAAWCQQTSWRRTSTGSSCPTPRRSVRWETPAVWLSHWRLRQCDYHTGDSGSVTITLETQAVWLSHWNLRQCDWHYHTWSPFIKHQTLFHVKMVIKKNLTQWNTGSWNQIFL